MNGSLLDRPVTGSVAWPPMRTASRPVNADYMHFAAMETTPFWARQQTRYFLDRCRGISQETAQDAQLLVSELVTNAYEASESTWAIGLSLRRFPRFLLIEVIDSSMQVPKLTNADDGALGGRGLRLVNELSNGWGYFYLPGCLKDVYCTLPLPEENE
jgi:anti-sigma regulatory factor (Ser/Thr protein kinase)